MNAGPSNNSGGAYAELDVTGKQKMRFCFNGSIIIIIIILFIFVFLLFAQMMNAKVAIYK